MARPILSGLTRYWTARTNGMAPQGPALVNISESFETPSGRCSHVMAAQIKNGKKINFKDVMDNAQVSRRLLILAAMMIPSANNLRE